ncbi:MAG: DUF2142 domain-containing protein [Chloroflexi bacterium]|nr:DUF2142 domain-containing protein [Chloroflexota bacterium]
MSGYVWELLAHGRTQRSNPPMNHRFWLGTVLVGYLLITLAYSVSNPLFEAPDEHWHYFTVQHIKDTQTLPVVTEDYDEWLGQEAAQPPLYYLLAAALISPINTANAREQVWLNPFFYAGDASILANLNQVVHTPQEATPWQGMPLAAHLLRFFSAVLGLGTLLCIFGSGRLLWPDKPGYALLATAVTAFLPQYNFVHASISNDPLIIFLSSVALWQLLWLWQNQVSGPRLLLLGISCGLAALTKNAGILLLIYTIAVLFLRALKDNTVAKKENIIRWGWQTAVYVILPTFLIAGWLWGRNMQLYGDFTATEPFIRIADGDRGYTLLQVFGESGSLIRSAVAVFGWFNLLAPTWVYAVWGGIVLLGMGGVIYNLYREGLEIGDWRLRAISNLQSPISNLPQKYFPAVLLLTWFLLIYAGLAAFMMRTPAAQGRLLFPAIVPLALGLAYGLTRWPWRSILWLVPTAALLTTLYTCFFVIRPAYAAPPLLAELPAAVEPLNRPFGKGLTLLGVDVETPTAVPGDIVWFTLYWQKNGPITEAPELVIELFGRDLDLVGSYHSYHGRGQYPATLWLEEGILADRVGIRITDTAVTPVLASILARLAADEGQREGVQIGAVKIAPQMWPNPSNTILAQIGDAVQLTAITITPDQAQPGAAVEIDVTWQTTAVPGTDLTTLIHLAQPNQPPLAQADNQPLNGQYPTRVWGAGDVIHDSYTLTIPEDLPNGRYPLWIGMYDSETLMRWPLASNGQQQPHDIYQIGWIEISKP